MCLAVLSKHAFQEPHSKLGPGERSSFRTVAPKLTAGNPRNTTARSLPHRGHNFFGAHHLWASWVCSRPRTAAQMNCQQAHRVNSLTQEIRRPSCNKETPVRILGGGFTEVFSPLALLRQASNSSLPLPSAYRGLGVPNPTAHTAGPCPSVPRHPPAAAPGTGFSPPFTGRRNKKYFFQCCAAF